MNSIPLLFIFGTRPEAIKMLPVVKEFQKDQRFTIKVCVTGQHREMLDQVLDFFGVFADYDLNVMKIDQDLFSLTTNILLGLQPILMKEKPKYVFVHGDTTTSMAASLAAFYAKCSVCHIEAGLRTYDKNSPYPEEINRQINSRIADYHFAPTKQAKNNLLQENVEKYKIIVTGNTVIDALVQTLQRTELLETEEIKSLKNIIDLDKKINCISSNLPQFYKISYI